MSINDLFWLFFVFTALQPVLRQRMLEAMRTRKIAQLERQRSSRVILLVHRQETMRLLGFPLMRYIDIGDSEEVLRAIHMTDDDVPLDIVLHTPGGLVLAALQIARAIRGHKAKVTVFVPHYAMSGGTLISLAADEIVMCEHAVLGPIDPQLGQSPAASLLKVVEQKPVAEIDDQTLILAKSSRRGRGHTTVQSGPRWPRNSASLSLPKCRMRFWNSWRCTRSRCARRGEALSICRCRGNGKLGTVVVKTDKNSSPVASW